jgi:FkbM family methyltransferase
MLKNLVRNLAKRRGYEILGYPRAYAAQRSLRAVLDQQRINLVLDVGANEGQFVGELRSAGYRGRVTSFEPLSSAHARLRACAMHDSNWTVAERTAIGAAHGSMEIHISGNSYSSSILPMLSKHTEAVPASAYVGTEAVEVNRLDDLFTPSPSDRILLKVDVQGYEEYVLNGAPGILGCCRAIFIEMSLVPLYEGQILALALWNRLVSAGFEPWTLEAGFRHPESGRLLQIDGLFVRSEKEKDSNVR